MEIPEQDGGSSFNLLLKKTFVDGYTDDDSRQMLKDSISQIPQEELPMAVKHTLLCLKTTVDNFNKVPNCHSVLVNLSLCLIIAVKPRPAQIVYLPFVIVKRTPVLLNLTYVMDVRVIWLAMPMSFTIPCASLPKLHTQPKNTGLPVEKRPSLQLRVY